MNFNNFMIEIISHRFIQLSHVTWMVSAAVEMWIHRMKLYTLYLCIALYITGDNCYCKLGLGRDVMVSKSKCLLFHLPTDITYPD